MSVDSRWYEDVNDVARQTPWAHSTMAAYALWGGLVALAVIVVLAWWFVARRRGDAPAAVATIWLTGLGSVIALVVNQQLISPQVARPRPCAKLPHAEVLLTCTRDYSFPSDHCMIAGALAAGLFVLHRWLGALAVVLAVILAFSRVYVGVHYPTDTVVGLLLGAVIGLLVIWAGRRPVTAVTRWLSGSRLRWCVVAAPAGGTGPVPVEQSSDR